MLRARSVLEPASRPGTALDGGASEVLRLRQHRHDGLEGYFALGPTRGEGVLDADGDRDNTRR